MNPPLAGRSSAILSRFPAFQRAPTPGKVLASIAAALGRDLDESERQMMGIQRSHRLGVAEEEPDVVALAALCDLQRADFFLLERLAARGYFAGQVPPPAPGAPPLTDQAREQGAYDLFLGRLKSSVRRTVAVLLEGCGTLWALLEGTAILIDADRLDASGKPDPAARIIEHLDDGIARGGFVHRMAVTSHAWKAGKPDDGKGHVYLVENPLVDRSTDDLQRRHLETIRIRRGGFFDGTVTVQVAGVANRTVKPMVINETLHEGFVFDGALTDGQKLVYAGNGKVLLDGADVTTRISFFRGALAATGGPEQSTFAPPPPPPPPPGTVPENAAVVVTPEHGLDRNFPRPAVTGAASLPPLDLRLGESTWRFSVEEGAFDASAFDRAVYVPPPELATLALRRPSGRVQLSWRENEPFAVSVLIPAELESLEKAGVVTENLPAMVRAGLERFRSAGIRLDVSYFDPQWVLDHSGLESLPPGPAMQLEAAVPALVRTTRRPPATRAPGRRARK